MNRNIKRGSGNAKDVSGEPEKVLASQQYTAGYAESRDRKYKSNLE